MTADAFSSLPPRHPVSLIDLVETATPEENHAFLGWVTQITEAAGGRVAIANEAIAPMIIPNEAAGRSDHAIGLLVVTHYPTRRAGQLALAKRNEGETEFSREQVRTYAARPVGRIESLFGRTLPYTLGRWGREPVPNAEDAQQLEAMIEAAPILGEQPDEARWTMLAQRAGNRPIWMLNFLEFFKTATYAEGAAPSKPISGAHAYQRYGRGMIRSLAAVGGRVGWSGQTLGQLAGSDDGRWHQVAIAVYPSAAAMMTMLALPQYRAAHIHRAAALARTRLLATQPKGRPE